MTDQSPVQPGDRIPDFERYDTASRPWQLYKDGCAQRLVMALVGDAADEAVRGEIDQLLRERFDEDVITLVMIEGTPDSVAALNVGRDGDLVLADDGAVLEFLRAGAPSRPLQVMVLDRAHRLSDRIEPGEEPLTCAGRELTEETGHVAGAIVPLPGFYTCNGISDHWIHPFLATGCEPSGEQRLDPSERLIVETFSVDEVEAMLRAGTIRDGLSLIALFQALPRLGG